MSDFDTVVRSAEQIAEYYATINRKQDLLVGIEWERSGVYEKTLHPVRYKGPNGYLAVMKKLIEEAGWEINEGHEDDISELKRGKTRVTIEGDGSLELSGAPFMKIHDLARELRLHHNELKEMGDVFDIKWVPLGWQPFHREDEIKTLEKDRYQIFKKVGGKQLMEYMKKSNGIHLNYSYTTESNGINKAQALIRTSPILSAVYCTSPIDNGELTDYINYRRYIIGNFNKKRTGLPPNILDEGFTFQDWIEYYFDLPVILIKFEGKDVAPKKFSFRDWIQEGYKGKFPTIRDFDQHVKTTWSDLRIRPGYLEYRALDSVPARFILTAPSLVKGLVFDSESWVYIDELLGGFSLEELKAIDEASWKKGMLTKCGDHTILNLAQKLLVQSNKMLHKFERKDQKEEDESVYLEPLKEQIFIKEKSFAEEIAENWEHEWSKNPHKLLEYCEL